MAKGIRLYGPGKFYTILDSYAYEAALDGIDEEASYGEGNGWYGLLWLDKDACKSISEIATENKDQLTKAEENMLDDHVAIIFFERSDGIVETDWFDNASRVVERWQDIEDDTAEEEEEEGDERWLPRRPRRNRLWLAPNTTETSTTKNRFSPRWRASWTSIQTS